MAIYGIYGLLLLGGLLILGAGFVLHGLTSRVCRMLKQIASLLDTPSKILLVAVLLLSVLVTWRYGTLLGESINPGEPASFSPSLPVLIFFPLVCLLILIALFLLVVVVVLTKMSRTARGEGKEQAEVAKWTRTIEKNPENASAHFGLAMVYERYNRFLKAAEEYHTVVQAPSQEGSLYARRAEAKEKVMRRLFAVEQEKKTFACPQCQAKNRPQQRRCSECGSALYGNVLRWMWENTSNAAKIGAAAVLVVSLLFLIRLPVVACLWLMAIWLSVISLFQFYGRT